ncbi:MAG: DUF493 domain-containing protein [Spirochaetes bacterium]|nr:DUF493 domain-containing protein [Spirochaetota bacterium]
MIFKDKENLNKEKKEHIYEQVSNIFKESNFIELGDLKDSNDINIKYDLPSYWLFKVIGDNNENFRNSISNFLKDKKLKKEVSIIYSKNSKYCSYNFEIFVENKEELFSFYRELKEIKETKFCF